MMLKRMISAASFAALLFMPGAAAALNPFHGKAWPKTDFSAFLVDPGEFIPGGPDKDGIPAIDAPTMMSASAVGELDFREPVVTIELPGETARAYPLRYLLWHEVVNDTIGATPVAVTYSALQDSVVVYDRSRADGPAFHFGVSGILRHADTVLFDRATESWWQQATGRAIVGTHAGEVLPTLPTRVESWIVFRLQHPEGLVMTRPHWDRDYGTSPFPGYDTARKPKLYAGQMPPEGIAPLDRVVRVGTRAWPLTRLIGEGRISEAGYMLSWSPGMASTLDTPRLKDARDIGMVRVRDRDGADLPYDVMFAFGFQAFWPDGTWMLGGCAGPGRPC